MEVVEKRIGSRELRGHREEIFFEKRISCIFVIRS